ncbi:CRISPR-associated endoribonuclease Cas6 [Candidatus Magnetobacterium casense]|uniref:CRISPR-associated endoribonuclease Cas6 n=1 Tax=Candidatus Magnetobacterium casense TaxID=1455061 RepID=UPI00058B88E1|nr:CRISPR-associated endoribonuclease Cas6 [Candidatus Magnetobacterium casensis]
MRIRVNCKAEKLPVMYRHMFMSMIIQALKTSNKPYKEALYPNSGEGNSTKQSKTTHSKVVKPFTFSVDLPHKSRVVKERFNVSEDVTVEETVFYFDQGGYVSLYVSSCDYEFIANLYNGLIDKRSFEFDNGILLEVDKIYMLNEAGITGDRVVFRTHSPVSIEGRDGKPLLPMPGMEFYSDRFNDDFNAIHNRLCRELRGEGLHRPLEFRPLTLRKKVVKHTIRHFVQRTGKPFMYLTVFEGTFEVIGDVSDLQLLYQAGVGLRTAQGFGMVGVEI